MKKRYFFVITCFVLIFALSLNSAPVANADALTASMVAASSYALAADWGITFTSGSATSTGMQNWMSSEIENYVNARGGSIASLFGSEVIRAVAGKLVIGQQVYNGVKQFISWLAEKYDLSGVDFTLSEGSYEDTSMGDHSSTSSEPGPGVGLAFGEMQSPDSRYVYDGYNWMRGYSNGSFIVPQTTAQSGYAFNGTYSLSYENNSIYAFAPYINRKTGNRASTQRITLASNVYSLDNYLSWNGTDYVEPTVLNPDKEWSGTIGGEAVPDTNLDQLMGNVFGGVADNNLDVDGEIIDIPVPPSPQPTVAPDIPLQDVPWEGLNDLIGNTAEGIQEQIQSQTESITSAQEATTEAVESLTDTLTDALDVPDAEELPDFKFDLRELFPFCIPFDIYRLLSSFDAQPQAPHVQIPIVIESIGFSHNLDLDFSAWNPVAQAMRTAELIVYAIALAWATGKVIKW